jgi:hypothetical protein
VGDVRGCDVGLLRGEAALLQRPGRHVAHCPDAVDATDAAKVIDRHETVELVRQASEVRSA